MLSHLPELADPWRLVVIRKRFSGQIAPKAFSRLAEAVEQIDDNVDYDLQFDRDKEGRAIVEGRVKARLIMACRRCFEPVDVEVHSSFTLGIVATDAEAERLPTNLDPVVVSDEPMRLRDLLEDELLLSLPQFPVHEQDECKAKPHSEPVAEENGTEKDNPFAVLAALKEKI